MLDQVLKLFPHRSLTFDLNLMQNGAEASAA